MAPILTPQAEAAHAFLAPSSADRWSYCSGSAWMESQFPDLADDEPRRVGTAGHSVFEHAFAGIPLAEGSLAPNGTAVTAAMIQGAEVLLADIEAKLRPYLGDAWRSAVVIEKRIQIPRVHPTHNWGTPDVRAWVATADGWLLFIWDYKFGFRAVEVFECKQLINYAAGCWTEAQTAWPTFNEAACTVVLTVVQPRAYHPDGPVRTWETSLPALVPYIHDLAMAAEEATGADPKCRPRPDVCHDCRARSGCAAIQDAMYMGLTMAQQAIPRVMSDEALGLEMAMLADGLELMKARYTGLEEVVKARIRAGARVPHWMYGPGRGSLAWKVPEAEVLALGDMVGTPLAKPREAITPTQAKAAGLLPQFVEMYAHNVAGATKLMRDDGSNVRRIFSLK